MYKYIKIAYNYIILLKKSIYIYNNSININDNSVLLDEIKNIIDEIGGIGIKFIQWILPYYKLLYPENTNIINKFSMYFKNCKEHNLNYTENIYYDNFNKSLYDNYKIVNLLGSGSIGQVYLIEDIISNKKYAMKVLHPDIKIQLFMFKIFYRIIKLFINVNNYFPIENLDILISELMKQLDFSIEYNNNNLLHKLYSDNDYILIPKIYKCKKNIIIMEYIDGIKYDINDEKINNNRSDIIYILSIFLQNNSTNNIMHGDLHEGNWCINVTEDNKIKLIIYDFGYCYLINDIEFKILLDVFIGMDKEILYSENIIRYYIYKNRNKHINVDKKEELINNFKNYQKYIDAKSKCKELYDDRINIVLLIKIILIYFLENNIYVTTTLLNNIIILFQLIGYYGDDANKIGFLSISTFNMNIYNTLEKYNICNKLKKNIKNDILNSQGLFDNNFTNLLELKKYI